jgi:uncharacterized Zn-finger protein
MDALNPAADRERNAGKKEKEKEKEKEKRFECTNCSRKFARLEHLQRHDRIREQRSDGLGV